MAAAAKNTGSGYLGELNAEQEKAFEAFKKSSRADNKTDVTNDDYALLRFLRARKFVVKDAEELRRQHMEWRKKYDTDNILKSKPAKLDLASKMISSSQHGVDKSGRPILFEKLGKAKGEAMTKLFTADEYLRLHNYKMSQLIARCDEQTKLTGKHCETFTLVIDAKGVTFSGNNGYLKECGENDNIAFPERLGRLIVINAPWVFPFFWKIVSPFIDAKTKAKIEIVYGNPTQDLLKTIDESVLPKEYGGKCECKGKDKPCNPEFDISDLKLSDITGAASDNVTTHVAAGKKHEATFTTKPKGGTLHWYFRVADDYNTLFSVRCRTADGKEEVIRKPEKMVTDQGSHTVDGVVTWTVTFDNGYSWRTGKNVQWSCMVMNKEDAPAIVGTADPIPMPSAPVKGKDEDAAAAAAADGKSAAK